MERPIKVRLHVLSPIHIGCDDVYEPTCFVIDELKKKLIEFDPLEFVKNLKNDERDKLNEIALSGNLLEIFKTIKRFYKFTIKGREVEVTDYLVNHYKKRILEAVTFDKNAVVNQFTILKTAYNPHTNMPYIPGSSVKGAIRTAFLNKQAKLKNITNFKGKSDELETLLLERSEGKMKIPTDPFRMVKVSDFKHAGDVKSKIIYAINRKKQKTDRKTLAEKKGVYQIFEVIQPGAIFEGIININTPLDLSDIKVTITADDLFTSLNKFYAPLLENEIKTLKDMGIFVPLINEINEKFNKQINKTAFIIRIGRHSGAEAITIEGNRRIKIMQGKNKEGQMQYEYKSSSTTIWLASESPKQESNAGLLPFGWAILEKVQENNV